MQKDAEARNVPLVAVTFLPDPVEVLFDGSPWRLLPEKIDSRALAVMDGIFGASLYPRVCGIERYAIRRGQAASKCFGCVHVGSDLAWRGRVECYRRSIA